MHRLFTAGDGSDGFYRLDVAVSPSVAFMEHGDGEERRPFGRCS